MPFQIGFRKLKLVYGILAIVVITSMISCHRYIWSLSKQTLPTNVGRRGKDVQTDRNQPTNMDVNRTKVILFWTTFFGHKAWFGFPRSNLGSVLFQKLSCEYSNCVLTDDHSEVNEADLLLFHYNDAPNWPKMRHPRQFYAHVMFEAPGVRSPKPKIDQYEGEINITINYRHDADFRVPYSIFVPKDRNKRYKPRVSLAKKTKMAVWPVSNCSTLSRREDYVKELSKYIEVDIVGACGKHKCPASDSSRCNQQWEQIYKYYLSFENNICEDYVTEKVLNPLKYELVPVVFGGGNYTEFVPPHSVINVRDFNSPKDLAEFLNRVAADEERYYSYFKWKAHFERVGAQKLLFCGLCESLTKNLLPRQPGNMKYADYWYGSRGEKCDNGLLERMRQDGGW